MNKSFFTQVKVALLLRGQTIKGLYDELRLADEVAYNTFYQILSGSRLNDEILTRVKAHLGIV